MIPVGVAIGSAVGGKHGHRAAEVLVHHWVDTLFAAAGAGGVQQQEGRSLAVAADFAVVGDFMIGSCEVPWGELTGGNDPEPARLVVVEGLDDLLAGVHHERPVVGDGRSDREPAQ